MNGVWRETANDIQEEKMYAIMNVPNTEQDTKTEWFAIKTRQEFRAEVELTPICEEVLFLKETIKVPGKRDRIRAAIPHVLFVKTTKREILELEQQGREQPEQTVPFWIYRYPKDHEIQIIHRSSIHLLRLLTSSGTNKCEIFVQNKKDFTKNQHVRVTAGPFQGHEGYVVRVKKNKHVVVKIEGICLIMLPFIHPDLLEPIE